MYNVPPLSERKETLTDICFDEAVVARWVTGTDDEGEEVTLDMIEVGIPGEEPICTLVPCYNHRVKHPIGFIKANGSFRLMTYIFRDDVYQLRGPRGGEMELDLFEPIEELLDLDLKIQTIATGYRGSLIIQTGFEEFALMVEATPIARMHTGRLQPAGSIKTVCRGMGFYITVPKAVNVGEIRLFAQAITPSFVAVSWSNERRRRDLMKQAS